MDKKDQKGIAVYLLKITLELIVQIVVAFSFKLLYVRWTIDKFDKLYLLLNFCLGFICLFVFIIIYRNDLKSEVHKFFKNIATNVFSIIFMYLVNFILTILISVFFVVKSGNQDTVNTLVGTNAFLTGINLIVVAPITEEIFFRGILFKTLSKRNKLCAYVFVSLLFGMAHCWIQIISKGILNTYPALLLYVMTGVILTVIYDWRKNIITSIGLHSLINTIVFLIIINR